MKAEVRAWLEAGEDVSVREIERLKRDLMVKEERIEAQLRR
ncbi:hypothetical protein ACW73L_16005 [Methylolobus aquaticus]